MARRSTRLSGARMKYANDPFELLGVSENSDHDAADASIGKGKQRVLEEADFSDDDEYVGTDGDDEHEEPDEADEDAEDERVLVAHHGKPDINLSRTARPKLCKKKKKKKKKKGRDGSSVIYAGDETHSRGMWNPTEHVGRQAQLRLTIGADERDILAIVYSRDRWYKGIDSGFPTRASLNKAQSFSTYGCGSTFGVDPDVMARESTAGWDWYYEDPNTRKRQKLDMISEEEARRRYLPRLNPEKHTVLVGPLNEQKAFHVGQHEFFNFGEAFGERRIRSEKVARSTTIGEDGAKGPPSARANEGKDNAARPRRKAREGWILNLGTGIQCLAWAPNQSGLTQYLALASPITEEQEKAYMAAPERKIAPAFSQSAPLPAALQIWAFRAQKEESFTKTLDMGCGPRLRLMLCSEWGHLRRMSWCPMARARRDEDEESVSKNVGLLATVWGDGLVRVLDMRMSRDPKAIECYKILSPFFAAKPPSTVCTCVTWLSPSDIAVGCANGYVAVWSIVPSHDRTQNPEPYVYRQVHSTYISSLASGYPTHAHLLASTSMDGETRLVSLLDIDADMVETTRMRIGSPHISYSPLLQSFFSGEENDFVRLLAVRRFFTSNAVARLPSTISALAPCSMWHPSVLIGCTGGSVIATNPIRRLLHIKEQQWQQTWFTHEWAPGSSSSSSSTSSESGSSGVSRFQDGFRAESISLSRNMIGEKRMVNGTMVVTIFDESTHIAALAWNPNQSCAGWASAALGCGLLRVEDLAIE